MTAPRILLCSQAAHTGGGVEVWLEDVSHALAKRGWDVIVALASGRFHKPDAYLQRHAHRSVVHLDGTRGFREQRVMSLVDAFRHVNPGVIFPVNLADALYAAAYWKRRGAKARLVTGFQKIHDPAMFGDLQVCAPWIDLATTISRQVHQQMRAKLEIEPDRILHIPTGVPAPISQPVIRDAIREIAYIGRLDSSEKRIFDSVEFIRRITQDVRFHFVGSGPAEAELRAALGDHAIFHGQLARGDLYRLIYPRIDALVVFSKYEAGPMVAWEAMRHGVVPVVSDFAGRAGEGVIRHRETGLVFPVGDMSTAAELVREFSEPGSLRQLSINARELLPRDYHFEVFEERWHTELSRCLDLPIRTSDRRLPRQVSPGAIARLGLPSGATLRLRKLLGARYVPSEPGAEWPHAYGIESPRLP